MNSTAAQTPPPNGPDGLPRKIPPLQPIRFPQCIPQAGDKPASANTPLVTLLQTVQRPADIQLSHFEALGIHVISDATPEDILPDASYLPPFEEWNAVSTDDLEEATRVSKKPLNNGNLSPGVQTYQERRKELSINNTAAFRTIRRIPAPAGELSVRLGNAYEFFKNLELFSGFWHDTSLPLPPPDSDSDQDTKSKTEDAKPDIPRHLQTYIRHSTGSEMPADYRQHLLTAFLKLVAYDFGCNVSFPRCEPRLLLTPPPASTKPPSYFNSSASFVYRTPTDRAAARSGIVEGPLCTLSSRASTSFSTPADSHLDFAREVVAILLTAQQRARANKTEVRFGEAKWWATTPRWGGGKGGPIGREVDALPNLGNAGEVVESVVEASKKAIGGIGEPASKRKKGGKEGELAIYETYRKMLPPSSTWDRRARYEAIGKVAGVGYDDIFLVSALNHHISVLRARVPDGLLDVLGGGEGKWDGVKVWRSRWYDLFLVEDRVNGMELIWGMMAWLMRGEEKKDVMDVG